MRSAGILVAAVIGIGCSGGTFAPLTEVRMVIDSDLGASNAVGFVRVSPIDQFSFANEQLSNPQFPIVVVIKPDATMQPFALTVELFPDPIDQVVLVRRNVRDVAFVERQQLMLVVPMLAKCACQGTACPGPGDPDCDDLSAPALAPLDARADRLPDAIIDLSRPPPIS